MWSGRTAPSLLRAAAPTGACWGACWRVPSSPWVSGKLPEDVLDHVPMDAEWVKQPGLVRHTFTHFHLELAVFTARISEKEPSRRRNGRAGTASGPRAAADGDAQSHRPCRVGPGRSGVERGPFQRAVFGAAGRWASASFRPRNASMSSRCMPPRLARGRRSCGSIPVASAQTRLPSGLILAAWRRRGL